MRNYNLRRKIEKVVVGTGLIAGLVGLVGCTPEDAGSVLLGTYAGTPAGNQYAANRRTLAGLTAGVLAKDADAKRAEDIALAGKTNIEIINNPSVQLNKRTPKDYPLEVGKVYSVRCTEGPSIDKGIFLKKELIADRIYYHFRLSEEDRKKREFPPEWTKLLIKDFQIAEIYETKF